MKKTARGIAVAATLFASIAQGDSNIDLDRLVSQYGAEAQSVFQLLSEDLTAALSYKALIPAEPLGLTGFDLGLEVTATSMENASQWSNALSDGDTIDTLPVPKIHAHKGLPLDIDLGVMLSAIPSTNVRLFGGELRYALLSGNAALPAVAIRGTVTRLGGVDKLTFTTKGLEATVSKGFAFFTPYVGVGSIWSNADPASSTGLREEELRKTKLFVGGNISLGVFNIAVEGDRTGDNATYGVKLGLRF